MSELFLGRERDFLTDLGVGWREPTYKLLVEGSIRGEMGIVRRLSGVGTASWVVVGMGLIRLRMESNAGGWIARISGGIVKST